MISHCIGNNGSITDSFYLLQIARVDIFKKKNKVCEVQQDDIYSKTNKAYNLDSLVSTINMMTFLLFTLRKGSVNHDKLQESYLIYPPEIMT